jgi:hypothetical protein
MEIEVQNIVGRLGNRLEDDLERTIDLGSYEVNQERPLDFINGVYLFLSTTPDIIALTALSIISKSKKQN